MELVKIWNQIPQIYCIFYVYINRKYSKENIHRCVWVRNKKEGKAGGNKENWRQQVPELQNLYTLFFDSSEKKNIQMLWENLSVKIILYHGEHFNCCKNLPFVTF